MTVGYIWFHRILPILNFIFISPLYFRYGFLTKVTFPLLCLPQRCKERTASSCSFFPQQWNRLSGLNLNPAICVFSLTRPGIRCSQAWAWVHSLWGTRLWTSIVTRASSLVCTYRRENIWGIKPQTQHMHKQCGEQFWWL